MARTAMTITIIIIIMITDDPERSLLRLLTWLSPAFPVGGFAYSGGLEAAVREGRVGDAVELGQWLDSAISHGPFWNDAVLLAEAWNAGVDGKRLAEASDLGRALAGSAERYLETTAQGDAFIAATKPWSPPSVEALGRDTPYAVAVGAVAAANGVNLQAVLVAWLHALASQLVSAAIRLSVLGQREAMALLADLEPLVLDTARRAENTTLDDLGSTTVIADIMSARHEHLHSRLFRS